MVAALVCTPIFHDATTARAAAPSLAVRHMDDTPAEAYLQGGLSTAWDDEDFELGSLEQALPAEEEEEDFALPAAPVDSQEPGKGGPVEADRPVLLLNLSGMAKQLGQDDSSVSDLRSQVIDALSASFLVKSAELLVSGLCWHSVNWRCAEDQQERLEELEPGSVMTVIPYPELIDGVPVDAPSTHHSPTGHGVHERMLVE